MYTMPALPYDHTRSRRKEARRLVRGYLGTSSSAAPTLDATLRAVRELKAIVDLASGGRYGLAIVKHENGTTVHEPVSDTIARERELREHHPELRWADFL